MILRKIASGGNEDCKMYELQSMKYMRQHRALTS